MPMQFLRISRDMYGQETLQGVSWDLIPWFAGAAAAFIVVHALYMALWAPRLKKSAGLATAAGDD
jgi:hypothetical protein